MKWFLVVVMMLLCVPIYATYEKWEKKEGLNSYEKRAVQNMKDYEAGVEEKVRRDALVELRSLDEKALKEIREELLQDLREVVKTALKTDNKWRVRVEAPATLVRLGAKDALDALLEVAREYKKKEVRSACVEAVAKLAERGDAESIKALGNILEKDGWSSVRAAAIDALAALGGVSELGRIRKAALEDKYSIVRAAAINAMVALGDDSEEAFNVAKAGLSDAYSVVRASACELSLSLKLKERILRLENEIIELTKRKEELEQRGDEETKAEMEKLSSQIQFLCEKRKRLSEAQSEISRKVIALLGDKKPLVQNAAAKSLREFVTEENLEQITGALKDAPEDMLCEIIWMYAGIGTEKALNLIAEKFLSSDDPDIKAEAACALASKGDARGIKEIKELLLGRTDPFRKIQLLRLLVRNKIYLEDVTTAVEQLLDSPEERLKSEAEKALKLLRSEKEGGKKGN